MALSSGKHLGAYEITGQIGSGGMGVVYRATDTKLKRDVAIKVLPAALANDAERLARFQREAEMLASLNHPNVAHIHGLEESDGTTALILELVEGPTLADRIAEGALSIDEALDVALQIAGALEAAHGQGIVHRDLKPANIKIKNDGTVKVLDFGIAKALDLRATSGLSPVMETPTVTQTGIILGTAAYMSPEQARGKGVDQRTDIWAFGCVLFEMLTGQQAFGGEDVTVMLARILEREPNMDALPKSVSPAVRHTIVTCIQKDVRKRFADIRDVKLSLGGALLPASLVEAELAVGPFGPRQLPAVAAALLVGLGLAGAFAWSVWPIPEPRDVNRFAYAVPADHAFRGGGGVGPALAISPDGRHFVYNTQDGLYLREMGTLDAHVIPGTEEELGEPFFSPDGQTVAYWTRSSVGSSQLKRIPLSGGVPIVIANDVERPFGPTWREDGTIWFGQRDGIYRVPADGSSPPSLVIPAQDQEWVYGPLLLPDGDSVLFSTAPENFEEDNSQLVVQSISTGSRTVLREGGTDFRYLPTGHLVYALENGLFAVAFDIDSLTISGAPVPLLQGVQREGGGADYGVSNDGTLIYLDVGPDVQITRTIVWVDREGREETLIAESQQYSDWLQLSPDGRRLAVSIAEKDREALWIYDLDRGRFNRLTVGTAKAGMWTPDGQRVVYRTEDGIAWQAADGTGQAEVLIQNPTTSPLFPYSFSPNAEHFVFGQLGRGYEVHMLSRQTGAAPEPLIADVGYQIDARISPNGDWIAYTSNETGQQEVVVRPFPDVDGGRWQVPSEDGGGGPVFWGADGRELFYFSNGWLTAVSIETDSGLSYGDPEALFPVGGDQRLSIDPNGQRFVTVKVTADDAEAERPQLIVVQNWFEEVRRLVPLPE